MSSSIYEKISGTGYYLADDYNADEMAGTYMGWHWIVGLLVLLFGFRPLTTDQRKFFILLAGILLITLPPSFTIGGVEIYTPSHLLYYVVPGFRSLVRWSAVIYLILLILNVYLFSRFDIKNTLLLAILNTLMFAVYLPVMNINLAPGEITYLRNLENKPSTILVYPDANFYSVFWVLSHKNALLNPSVSSEYKAGLTAKEVTLEALSGKSDYKFDYIVVYFERIGDDEAKTFLPLINTFGPKVYEDSRAVIYKVNQ
uniref:Uncharacterized protein n=1 Tax=candidate division WWE3 bacterium TaxID=2053526 RepID=A0A7C4TLA6_UNCKA